MSKTLNIFAPFAKVNTTEDGGREVWGFATLERVDKSNEIADFDGTLQAFQTWSDEISKNTQGKSLGNVRVMHQQETGGTVIDWQAGETKIEVDGVEKDVRGIWVGSKIPAHKTDVIADIDAGILSAYSLGGSYAKKWLDVQTGAKRYIPKMSELSLVDNPAVPGAEFQMIKSATGPWDSKKNEEVVGLTAEQLAKAAAAAGISIEQMTAMFAELAKAEKPVDGDGDDDKNKEFPNKDEDATKDDEADAAAKDADMNKDDMEAAAKSAGGEGEELAKSVTGSYEHIQALLRTAVNNGWNYRSLEATFPDHVVVHDWDNDKWYSVPYTITENVAVLGDAVEVEHDFKPIAKSAFGSLLDIEPELAKAGASISEHNRGKLHKAASHIMDTCKCAKCMKAAGIFASEDGTNNGEEAQEPPVIKLDDAVLQKAVGISFAQELEKADLLKQGDLVKFASEVSEMAKAVSAISTTIEAVNKSVEAVGKQVETFEKSANERLKAIEEAPVSGGPLLYGATGQSGNPPVQKAAGETALEHLNKALELTTDPLLKDSLGRQIATLEYKNQR